MILAEIYTLYPNTKNIPNNGKVKYNFKKPILRKLTVFFLISSYSLLTRTVLLELNGNVLET